MSRLICLFLGHRWQTPKFIRLGQTRPEEYCTRCGAWREL